MCNYLHNNQCTIIKSICPWAYYCNKKSQWLFKSEGSECKVLKNQSKPDGYFCVRFEKHGYLYVDMEDHVEVIQNPFDEVPLYVKASKMKNGKWRLKKYEG